MARRMKQVRGAARSVVDAPENETLEASPPSEKGGKRIGRPATRPETIARQKAEEQAKATGVSTEPKLSPQEMKPITIVILRLVSRGIKGDAPTLQEVDLVNEPATAVANKYGLTSRWGSELALLGAVVVVSVQMRQRQQDKDEAKRGDDAKRDRGNSGTQGKRENAGIPLAVVEAVESARGGSTQ